MRDSVEIVASNLGSLLTIFALLMVTPAIVAVAWAEWYTIPAILAAAGITGAVGRVLTVKSNPTDPEVVHGIVTAAVGWLCAGVAGALPILFVAHTSAVDPGLLGSPPMNQTMAAFRSPVNALFEGMSGVTGTGLTMALREDELPRSLHWWRSLMQWVGGIGVVVLAAAVVLTGESNAFQSLYQEHGAVKSIRSDTEETVKTVWWIFCLLTFVAAVSFWLAGMPLWHALNHAMTGISTGGFVVTADGIAAYDSPIIELVILPFMMLGAISFAVHYYILQGHLSLFWRDAQTRLLFAGVGIGSLLLAGVLWTVDPLADAVRYGVFQLVSALTCTGFQTDTGIGNRWPASAHVATATPMIIGGAAGSTAGGIKLIRLLSLSKGSLQAVTDYFYDDDAQSLEIGQEEADVTVGHTASEFEQAAVIGFLWIAILFVVLLTASVVLPTHTLGEVLFEVASAQGNVGLSSGITGPNMPDLVKVVFVASMWIGRLEIVPVLVTIRVVIQGFE